MLDVYLPLIIKGKIMQFKDMFLKGLLIAIAAGVVLVFCLKLIYNISDKSNKGGIQLLETEMEFQMQELERHNLEEDAYENI